MEKITVKYVRVLVNQKEDKKQKSFLENYKDSIGTIASLCAIATVFIAVFTFILQFTNSHQAAEFYNIEQNYYFQESIVGILSKVIKDFSMGIFFLFFPFIPRFFIYKFDESQLRDAEISQKSDGFSIFILLINIVYLFCLVQYVDKFVSYYCSEDQSILIHWLPTIFSKFFFLLSTILFLVAGIRILTMEKKYKNFFCLIMIVAFICTLLCFLIFVGEFKIETKPKDANWQIFGCVASLYYIWKQIYYIPIINCKMSKLNVGIMVFLLLIMLILTTGSIIIKSTKNFYADKKTYEVVQYINSSDLNTQTEQKGLESNLQVVILHRDSQVLLMNGSIEDEYSKKTISNPKEISSSSNLYLDISSYEIQDADKYIFYRKSFNTVMRKDGDKLLDMKDDKNLLSRIIEIDLTKMNGDTSK
jgi:membrane protein